MAAAADEFQWIDVNGNHTDQQKDTMKACIEEFGRAKKDAENSYDGLRSGWDRWSGARVLLLSNKGMLLVADAEKQPDMSHYEGMIYVTLVCVLPPFRRQGNATRLLKELIHTYGHETLVLDVEGNKETHVKEMYIKAGFKVDEDEDEETGDVVKGEILIRKPTGAVAGAAAEM
jgi:ribosomal protein S18 acetylase RimI-like enzyme